MIQFKLPFRDKGERGDVNGMREHAVCPSRHSFNININQLMTMPGREAVSVATRRESGSDGTVPAPHSTITTLQTSISPLIRTREGGSRQHRRQSSPQLSGHSIRDRIRPAQSSTLQAGAYVDKPSTNSRKSAFRSRVLSNPEITFLDDERGAAPALSCLGPLP